MSIKRVENISALPFFPSEEEWEAIISQVSRSSFARIGEGGIGKIFLYQRDKGTYAIKVLPNSQNLEKYIRRERELLVGKSDCHLVNIYGSCVKEDASYILMEYVEGIDLYTFLKRSNELNIEIPLPLKIQILYQVAQGLHYLHSQHLSHRDLKPDNILVSNGGEIKIADFSYVTEDQRSSSLCGTPNYMPPEVITGFLRKDISYSPLGSDLWTFGCLTAKVILGESPFKAEEVEEIDKLVAEISFIIPKESFAELEKIDPDLANLVRQLLTKNPRRRLEHFPKGFETVLESPVFQNIAKERGEKVFSQTVAIVTRAIKEEASTAFSDF